MSTLAVNTITNAAGGNTAQINGMTPTADSLQGFRNRILNGGMVIDQRNAGAAVTLDNSEKFPVDRFACGDVTDGSFTAQQVADAPAGFINSLKCTVTSADSSLAATQSAYCFQSIEGLNIADLGWGAAGAATVTLSFWVKSSLTGTFGGALRNSAANRSYPYTYTISAANTWEQKTVTIAGDTSGTWLTTNGVGINVQFSLGAGSDRTGTAGAWNSNNNVGATGQTQVIGTNGATWQVTGVQLEAGSVATPFERRPYGTELALCQRYFQTSCPIGVALADPTTPIMTTGMAYSVNTVRMAWLPFVQQMRVTPTLVFFRSSQTATAGQWGTYDGSSWTAVTTTSLTDSSPVGMTVDVSRSGAFTTRDSYLVTGAYAASAEL